MKNEYRIEGDVVTMEVQGVQAIFDLADFPKVDRFGSWKLARGTSISTDFRHETKMCKITLHKLLTGSKFVKWLNGNTFDFRRENMVPIKKSIRPRPCGMTLKGNEYRIEGGMIVIPIHSKGVDYEIWADIEDYNLISQYTWNVNSKNGYAQTKTREGAGKSKGLYMHRLILGLEDPSVFADHINGLKLDNRRGNLRSCRNSENLHNTHRHRDQTAGIFKTANGTFEAHMNVNCVSHRKIFKTFDEAVEQYRKWEEELNPSGLNDAVH